MLDLIFTDAAAPHRQAVDVDGWCDQRRARGLGLFALVDCANEPGRTDPWRPSPGRAEQNLFAPRTGDAAALAVAPRLLELPAHVTGDARLRDTFRRQSAELPRGVLIASGLSLQMLASRLERRIDVMADGKDMMLRFWDSRIFLSLHEQLPPASRELWTAFGEQALVSDRCGGFVALGLSCPVTDPLASHTLQLEPSDLKRLTRDAHIDAVLGLLRQHNPQVLAPCPDPRRHMLAREQVAQCVRRDLRSPRDHALALSLAIEHGADWWDHEAWRSCVQQAHEGTLLKAYLNHMEAA